MKLFRSIAFLPGSLLKRGLLGAIFAYRCLIAPFFSAGCCRFTPNCSHYAEEALRAHSLPKALLLTLRRVLRCHPWARGGYDPVPGDASLS